MANISDQEIKDLKETIHSLKAVAGNYINKIEESEGYEDDYLKIRCVIRVKELIDKTNEKLENLNRLSD
jgi:GTP1/Obg family GTP-binding protein